MLYYTELSLMACAAPAAPSTKETTNYARLCRLLVELQSGTKVVDTLV